jgi:hypothetical protein
MALILPHFNSAANSMNEHEWNGHSPTRTGLKGYAYFSILSKEFRKSSYLFGAVCGVGGREIDGRPDAEAGSRADQFCDPRVLFRFVTIIKENISEKQRGAIWL